METWDSLLTRNKEIRFYSALYLALHYCQNMSHVNEADGAD